MAVSLIRRERQYEAWHGRHEDIESLANLLVTRGEEPAKRLARETFEAWVARAYDEALAQTRRDLGLPAEGAIPAERRGDYDRRVVLIDQDRAQRRRNIEDQLRASMTSFSYMTRGGRTQISTSPDLYRQIPVGALSAIMTLNVTYPPTASITLTLRKKPYALLELAVAGANEGWVATTFETLDNALSDRQPRFRRWILLPWTKAIIGVLLWIIFLVPLSSIMERLPQLPWLITLPPWTAVPLAILPMSVVSWAFDLWNPPFAITRSTPGWFETGFKTVGLLAVTAAIRELLAWIARLLTH